MIRPVVPSMWREQRAVLLLFIVVVSFVIFVLIPTIALGFFVPVSIRAQGTLNTIERYTQGACGTGGRRIAVFKITVI